MVINVANLGRKPYIPLSSHVNLIMHDLGMLMRGEIIWDKSASAGSSCAWGSFKSASNPCLRDVHEYLLVFSKGGYKLERTSSERAEGRVDSIDRDEFIHHTKSIWSFPTESARRVNHPAPFPVELRADASNCIPSQATWYWTHSWARGRPLSPRRPLGGPTSVWTSLRNIVIELGRGWMGPPGWFPPRRNLP